MMTQKGPYKLEAMTYQFTLGFLSQGPIGKGVNALLGIIDPNYYEKEPDLLLYKGDKM